MERRAQCQYGWRVGPDGFLVVTGRRHFPNLSPVSQSLKPAPPEMPSLWRNLQVQTAVGNQARRAVELTVTFAMSAGQIVDYVRSDPATASQ